VKIRVSGISFIRNTQTLVHYAGKDSVTRLLTTVLERIKVGITMKL